MEEGFRRGAEEVEVREGERVEDDCFRAEDEDEGMAGSLEQEESGGVGRW